MSPTGTPRTEVPVGSDVASAGRRALKGVTGGVAGAAALLGAQLFWAVRRPYPSFEDLDASGVESAQVGRWIDMVVLGDSTCTGPGLTRPEDIWVRQFARLLTPRFQVRVHSVAVGGSKASDVTRDQLDAAMQIGADLALVSVGGNDALRGARLPEVRRHLDTITRSLHATHKLIVLSGLGDLGAIPRLPPPLANLARARGRRVNQIHRDVAARHGVLVADQWEWSVKRFNADPRLFAPDQFHAAAAGHAIWAQVAYETVQPHLGRLDHM